jgi:hypothetical protein
MAPFYPLRRRSAVPAERCGELSAMLLATINSGLYKFFLVCHILVAIVGLGAVMLNGLYGVEAKKRQGPTGRAVAEANFAVGKVAEYFIYAIPLFGFALIGLSDKVWKFSQTWIWLALLLYVIALGIAHGVLRPSAKKMNALMLEMEQGPPPSGGAPPQVVEMQALGQRLGIAGMTNNLIVVLILFLMVWKPGV